jgi:hypothetical protein
MENDIYDWSQHAAEAAALDGNTVDFRVPLEQGGVSAGMGTISAYRDPHGILRVSIDQHSYDGIKVFVNRVWVPLEERGNLIRNPAGSKCAFSFMAV